MKLVISRDVERQLDEIYDYLAERSPRAAAKFYNNMLDEMARLAIAPEIASIEWQLVDRPEGFRSLVVRRRYKIIYFIDGDRINVILIWDCRRSPSLLRQNVLMGRK
jgi:plasmid stabilization system protein ParE